MIEICGKPILQYQIENLKACGLTDITISVGHLGHVIKEYFGGGSKFGAKINYFTADPSLGTAGALFKILDGRVCADVQTTTVFDEDFLLLCGDVILDIDFNRFIAFHKELKAWASLMAHPNRPPYDSSLLVTEVLLPAKAGGLPVSTYRVTKWMAKEDERTSYKNLVNAGLQLISPELLRETIKTFVLRHSETPDKINLVRDVLKPGIKTGKLFAYETPEYIKDMGTATTRRKLT